jgi:hypothetical protein
LHFSPCGAARRGFDSPIRPDRVAIVAAMDGSGFANRPLSLPRIPWENKQIEFA